MILEWNERLEEQSQQHTQETKKWTNFTEAINGIQLCTQDDLNAFHVQM